MKRGNKKLALTMPGVKDSWIRLDTYALWLRRCTREQLLCHKVVSMDRSAAQKAENMRIKAVSDRGLISVGTPVLEPTFLDFSRNK